ncbi:MmcQ/YjbR family DNA-binding protein [Bradymonadaceae bacterium TMQ3]|uniref:MmcQ/YjbR family DNA-binding protein n=1 Tax=Lujinxingia sediminis TaxID=2480984 RepID=A0ABY0CVQ5_9DELT|nr:MmcQ/YjbR family DNA-binding protein [Lujinxingia sediminis]RDV37352.1 MmcQ/YjbR family DNA-binding protein [Bradymonadaceae bacterium TMQ3]RVU46699.1 MmcQ/YjbR family DNA-binding protein [Lujinxingia sediminis]TXC74709.1 MmcQ/YjbR family DNA-binding protein [Bradymonadales bacterium TMQ1]
MDIWQVRDVAMALPEVSEDFPFDEHTLVMRVMDKIFLLMNVQKEPASVNLKCEPERAIELRARYEAVLPGYHMNKRHWNTVMLGQDVRPELMRELIEHSYERVVAGLKKADREKIRAMREGKG